MELRIKVQLSQKHINRLNELKEILETNNNAKVFRKLLEYGKL